MSETLLMPETATKEVKRLMRATKATAREVIDATGVSKNTFYDLFNGVGVNGKRVRRSAKADVILGYLRKRAK